MFKLEKEIHFTFRPRHILDIVMGISLCGNIIAFIGYIFFGWDKEIDPIVYHLIFLAFVANYITSRIYQTMYERLKEKYNIEE